MLRAESDEDDLACAHVRGDYAGGSSDVLFTDEPTALQTAAVNELVTMVHFATDHSYLDQRIGYRTRCSKWLAELPSHATKSRAAGGETSINQRIEQQLECPIGLGAMLRPESDEDDLARTHVGGDYAGGSRDVLFTDQPATLQ
jgi:hypothetical protein